MLELGLLGQSASSAPVAQWSTVLFGEPKSSGLSSRRPRVRFPPGALRKTRRISAAARLVPGSRALANLRLGPLGTARSGRKVHLRLHPWATRAVTLRLSESLP